MLDKADVYTFGVTMYVLTTGQFHLDVNEKPLFEFDEPIWGMFSDAYMEFVEDCLIADPAKRRSIRSLRKTDFYNAYKKGQLSDDFVQIDEEEEKDEDINCYKIQISSVLNEIVHRFITINESKSEAVKNIENDFQKQCQ